MTLKRLSRFSGELSDSELEDLLAAALRDAGLMNVVHQIVANARAIYDGTEEENYDLHSKLRLECGRIALALYPTSVPNDWSELQMQVRAYFIKLALGHSVSQSLTMNRRDLSKPEGL